MHKPVARGIQCSNHNLSFETHDADSKQGGFSYVFVIFYRFLSVCVTGFTYAFKGHKIITIWAVSLEVSSRLD